MKDNFSHPRKKAGITNISYSICYETPGTSTGFSAEEIGTDVKSCTFTNVTKFPGPGGYMPDIRTIPKWKFKQQ